MTAPQQAALYFLQGLLMGVGLGLVYGFLRPLRPKALADGLFVAVAFVWWVYLAFGICAGDIRPGYTIALALGAAVWEATIGRLLRPLFRLFWQVILWLPKKIFEFSRKIYKFLLAILKKWVTIVRTITKVGGAAHGEEEIRKTDTQKDKSRHKSRHSGRNRPVIGGADGVV